MAAATALVQQRQQQLPQPNAMHRHSAAWDAGVPVKSSKSIMYFAASAFADDTCEQ